MRAPRSSRLPIVVTVACLAVFAGWLGLQVVARLGHEPTRALLAGVDPLRAELVARSHEDYTYAGSSWTRYLEVEERHTTLDRRRLEAFADDLATEIGWWLLAETGERDLRAAEEALWGSGRQRGLPLRIARALVDRGVVFRPESLLSRSFADAQVHLDCDQLVHLLLHVAWRLDLDIRAVPAPLHLYAIYREPGGERQLTIETTRFAEAAEDADDFLVDRFFHRTPRSGVPVPDPALIDAARLYEPLDDRGLEDEIVANVVLGLVQNGVEVDRFAELEARLDGTRNTLIVSNLHVWLLAEARTALEKGSAELAARRAARAIALRGTHGDLNVWSRREENVVMGDAMRRLRRDPAALAALDRAISRGEAPEVCTVLEPLGEELATLLPSCG